MNRRRCTTLLIGFLLLAATFVSAPGARGEETPQQVLIGVLAKRGVDRCLEKWSPTADYLSSQIPGKRFVIVPLEYDQIFDPFRLEPLNFIICNPSVYVDLEIEYGAMRIATLKNLHAGRSFTRYGGVIFTRQERSDIRRLEDLKGKSFMAVEEHSLGGWHAAWRELAARGIDPRRDLKNFHFAGTHDAVVLAVRDGLSDAGTVRTDTLERMQTENKIDLDDFFIIPVDGVTHENLPFVASTRLYPEWPIAKMGRTSDELGVAVAIALLQITLDNPAAVAGRYAGWTIPLNYQDVHDLLRELKIGPYRDLGKITFADVLKKYWYWLELIAAGFLILAGFTVTIMKLNRRLKTSHFRLEAEVGERRLVEKRLIQARDQAEAATRAKSEFLANMSHEIRTPMNGVIAAAELALSEKLPERAAHYLEIIHTSAYSLLGIINDILDFSKIEAEKMALEARPFMLDEILDNVVDVFHNKVAENRIELLVDIDPGVPRTLVGDPLRLQQILTNLVSNSVKFTDKGGVILVGLVPAETTEERVFLKFFVKDTGIGIAPEYLPLLFQSFSQADASSTRKYQGTGLGLAICKQLVQMMGGTIWVESELGKGSTFYFTAGFERCAGPPPPKFVPPADIQGLNVLVVDDCNDSLVIMQKMLESFGFAVQTADSAEEALERLGAEPGAEGPFDLVLMDWKMPGMDGIAAARRIRRDLKRDTVIILMTAFEDQSVRNAAQREGINGFLAKPIYQSELFNAVMDAFGKTAAKSETTRTRFTTRASIYKERLRGFRVLLAEDNPTNREIATAVLESAGIQVETAANGREAVDAVQAGAFEAVLMDIQMPEMDGFEATRAIRAIPAVGQIPIIAMTAHAMKGDEEKCLAAGMDGYVSKPINQDRLFHTLWRTIKRPATQLACPLPKPVPAPDASAAAPPPSAGPLPDSLPGIEVRKTLETLSIDPATFRRILIGFAEHNAATAAALEDLRAGGDHDALRQLAHSIKGSAANIGATRLSTAARELEKTLAAGQTPDPVTLSALTDTVGTHLAEVLAGIATISPAPAAAGGEGPAADPAERQAKLDGLAEALQLADPETIPPRFAAARAYLPAELAAELAASIAAYEYDKALERLRSLPAEAS
ncbi:MAG: response regulator [Desulfobacteraceae bacterium]|nr:response regulator [Desulfobacteraceae bacterium]